MHILTDSFDETEWALLDSIRPTDPVRKKFAKVLMYLDKSIGAFVTALEDGGWLENSIIVVASDNGGCPVNGGNNYPLRGLKHSYWEGGNKVSQSGFVIGADDMSDVPAWAPSLKSRYQRPRSSHLSVLTEYYTRFTIPEMYGSARTSVDIDTIRTLLSWRHGVSAYFSIVLARSLLCGMCCAGAVVYLLKEPHPRRAARHIVRRCDARDRLVAHNCGRYRQ